MNLNILFTIRLKKEEKTETDRCRDLPPLLLSLINADNQAYR